MNFKHPSKFINPKQPSYNKGYLIIESDDSNIGDYTHWFPRIKRSIQKHSQWIDSKIVTLGLNTNTQVLSNSDKVTLSQLLEMNDYGFEIIAHNRHHIGLGRLTLTQEAKVGDTKIFLNTANNTGFQWNQSAKYIYTLKIYDGTKEEIVQMKSHNTSERSVTLSSALTNTFSVGSGVVFSDEAIETLIKGSVEDINSWGLEAKNYSFPYHAGSYYNSYPEVVEYAGSLFDSVRGSYDNTNDLNNLNWSNLNGMAIRTSTNLSEIDTQLDLTAENNLLMIAFGHGESDDNVLMCLNHLIDGAFKRGIKIISRSEAVRMFKTVEST